jgi:hypothetical protein
MVAMLLTAGINGMIRAIEPPISRAVVLVVNDIAQKHVRNFFSLNVPQPYWTFTALNSTASLVYALFAIAVAMWLYRAQFRDSR